MFVTQTDLYEFANKEKKASRFQNQHFYGDAHQSRAKSLAKKKVRFQKFSSINDQFSYLPKKSSSTISIHFIDTIKESRVIKVEKWNKIVDLYNTPIKPKQTQERRKIKPGFWFYKLLTSPDLQKYNLRINFPETFMEVSGDLYEIKTNSKTGMLETRKIQRQSYLPLMRAHIQNDISKLEKFHTKYKAHYDYKQNPFAPVIVTKIPVISQNSSEIENIFDVDVQSYKTFDEKRSKPSSLKIIQRFIYPRNMRAIIIRICYHRKKLGQQRQQFFGYRFQNIDNIFRVNKKNSQIYESFKLQSTISATYDRQYKFEYSKIINLKGLDKYIKPSKELIRFLEVSHKIKIEVLYSDYVVDLFNEPWLINIKHIQYEENYHTRHQQPYSLSLHVTGSYGICRLCSIQHPKKKLSKSISNKMLCQFLAHLKKRMKVDEYELIKFDKEIIKKNMKNYITFQVCDSCYLIVAQQYKLMGSQKKMGLICNILSDDQIFEIKDKPKRMGGYLKQWRLMVYLVGVEHIPQELLNGEQQVLVKYRLGLGDSIEQAWKIRPTQNTNRGNFQGNFYLDLQINQIKMHYFYSQNFDIDSFLKETQITLYLATPSDQKAFAKGSTSTISSLARQFHPQQCLKQTSSVLLFYKNGLYCEMTIKVGLICDGVYQVAENLDLVPLNGVYFTNKKFTNSNPIPKQWMEAFGINEQNSEYEGVLAEEKGNTLIAQMERQKKQSVAQKRKKIERKSLNMFRY